MSKIVIIGGTGLIGSKVVAKLSAHGHEAIAASPNTGVNTLTGEGLADVLVGADTVLDVSNSPSFADDDVMRFFTTATANIIAAAKEAGIGHYVALSVVGAERMTDSGYQRAKVAQENLIKASGIPYSLIHATQFFEFVTSIAATATVGDEVRLSHALIQPIAAEDVATAVARTTVGEPLNATIEVAGPEQFGLDDLIRAGLGFAGDPRTVLTDAESTYFGQKLDERMLLPGADAVIFATRFEEWLASAAPVVVK
ncbi:SDR family oxidoreductase [Lacisediminihabitans profunda]|uniref:SDR family oxidoreductase n=1 Tax=Lacisediminihabitans profunda TaxID=2594790 RepID=A0A5C8UM19_9MICO|nr:SDR family oxidoreductase [Lacisediminihabitans profunda]TXN28330.1 SDR family oxidoreductase [Lacisediminihabitans profunda]